MNLADKKTAAALGIFDGIHDGHKLILKKALFYTGFRPAVFTFDAESIKTKHGKPFEYIYTNRQKLDLIKRYGFKIIESCDFESLKNLSGEEFVKNILVDKMNAGAVVCGEDFRFGKNAACNAGDLRELGEKYGFQVETVKLEKRSGCTLSSELIREYIRQGRIREIEREFRFRYELEFKVAEGSKIGRTINFPTINQYFAKGQLMPKRGVYESRTFLKGKAYLSVTNIGVKPTVGNGLDPVMETHILDFSQDLYGKYVSVALTDFIREERKFSSLEELKKQINADIEYVRNGKDK